MNSAKLIILAGIILIIVSAGIVFTYLQILNSNTQLSPSPLPSPISRFGQSPNPTSNPQGAVKGTQTTSGTNVTTQPSTGDESNIPQSGIYLENILNSSKINSPQVLVLQSNVISNQVSIDLKDANGKVLTHKNIAGCQSVPCQLETVIYFEKPNTLFGTIEAYSSNQDGTFVLPTITVGF